MILKKRQTTFRLLLLTSSQRNPPYMIGQHGIQNVNSAKTIARHEVLCTLDDILRESARLLTFHGRFYMVHRPFRLAEIFTKMTSYGIEPKRIRFVHPYVDKEPNMVLIEGSNKGRSRMQVDPPLIVYEKDGSYTGVASHQLWDGKGRRKVKEELWQEHYICVRLR